MIAVVLPIITALLASSFAPALVLSKHAMAAEPPISEYQGIPTSPSVPTLRTQKRTMNILKCERQFLYRGKRFECDSHLEADAERLRPVLAQVPAALAQLNEYQKIRKDVKKLAYAGGLGFLLIIGGSLAGSASGTFASDARTIGVGGGIAILATTLITGLASLQASENRLDRAVEIYNRERPQDPIELQFSTGFQF